MDDWRSLAYVRWECKYHVVIIPKFRKKMIYGQLRQQVGRILRELCDQRGVELIEGKAMADHVHLCLSIPLSTVSRISDRFFERQECRADPPESAQGTPDDRAAFLVDGVLCQHNRSGGRTGPGVHSRAGAT